MYAIVKNGAVQNIVLWDGDDEWSAPDDCLAVKITDSTYVQIGYLYDGAKFAAPPQ